MLKDKILVEIKEVQDEVSVVLKDLTKNEWIIRINENRVVPSASIIKILIMVEALAQVQEGKYSLNQKVKIKISDKVDFSIITELNTDEYTFKDLITLMVIASDNTATNVLINLLSFDKINEMANKLGIYSTVLERKMMDFKAVKEGKQNKTSALDMALILEKIYRKTILTPEACELMIDILSKQQYKDCLPRYITDNVKIAHKTGSLDYLNHDIGIFYLKDRHYILGIFVTAMKNNLERKRIIGRISKIAYDFFTEGEINRFKIDRGEECE